MSHRQYLKKFDPLVQFPPATYCPANGYPQIDDATATEPDVLAGKTFYSGAMPIRMGTMPDRGAVSTDITTKAQEVTIACGKHSGAGIVKISLDEQAKIIPTNIKNGVTILGVTGTYESDPATLCPANGYIKKDDGKYEPPVSFPSPNSDEIILLVSNTGQKRLAFKCQGAYTVRVESTAGALIFTENKATNTTWTYALPAGYDYVFVRIRPQASNVLSLFTTMYWSGYAQNYPIVKAVFNTPNMVTLTSAFAYMSEFRACEFTSTLNSLTAINNMFQNCGIGYFKFPASMPALTSATYMFSGSEIKSVDFNNCSLNVLTDMSYMFEKCYVFNEIIFNPVVPLLTSLAYIFSYASTIKIVNCNFDMQERSVAANLSNMFQYAYGIEDITFPNMNLITSNFNISYVCYNCPRIKKIKFRGNMPFVVAVSQSWTGATIIEEVDYGNIFGGVSYIEAYYGSKLKKISIADTTYENNISITSSPIVEEISGNGLNVQSNAIKCQSPAIKTFDCPNFKAPAIWLGMSGAPITAVNMDFANSAFNNQSNPTIMISGSLPAAEINRIFSALPTVSGLAINVVNNPGYAGCTKSIATAKGWTVY